MSCISGTNPMRSYSTFSREKSLFPVHSLTALVDEIVVGVSGVLRPLGGVRAAGAQFNRNFLA